MAVGTRTNLHALYVCTVNYHKAQFHIDLYDVTLNYAENVGLKIHEPRFHHLPDCGVFRSEFVMVG